MDENTQKEALRGVVQRFSRSMKLLRVRQTPCGKPLSLVQAHALMFLREQAVDMGPPSQQVLADHLGVDKSTVTRLVKNMTRQGLVGLMSIASDKRVKDLVLTDKGRNMGSQVDAASRTLFGQVLARLSPDSVKDALIGAGSILSLPAPQPSSNL
jgi:DNA-binding MarR family transcriptional regulator